MALLNVGVGVYPDDPLDVTQAASARCNVDVLAPARVDERLLDDRSGEPDDGDARTTFGVHAPTSSPDPVRPTRSKRCLYTLTPDRDFVVDRLPGHPSVTVGLGAAHGFKFAALFGRLLTDVAVDGESPYDLCAFRLDRPALTDPSYVANWMV